MDGKGHCMDNIFVERLWRSLKYEEVYIHSYASVAEATAGIGAWLRFYNDERQHQSHGYRTPRAVYEEQGLWICGRSAAPTGSASSLPEKARKAGKCSPSPTYPQAQPPTKDLMLMIWKVEAWHQPSR
jgi:putative transposase